MLLCALDRGKITVGVDSCVFDVPAGRTSVAVGLGLKGRLRHRRWRDAGNWKLPVSRHRDAVGNSIFRGPGPADRRKVCGISTGGRHRPVGRALDRQLLGNSVMAATAVDRRPVDHGLEHLAELGSAVDAPGVRMDACSVVSVGQISGVCSADFDCLRVVKWLARPGSSIT